MTGIGIKRTIEHERDALGSREARAGHRRVLALRRWFRSRQRTFPWRDDPSPWAAFLAEMLLRRTRASQVAQHLPAILASFPSPMALHAAGRDDVMRTLQPLGLTWRAETIRAASKAIVERHGGEVPLEAHDLMRLPGVGPYVAYSTLATITGAKVSLIDTNTVRVALRVEGVEASGDVRRRKATADTITRLLGGPADAQTWWAVLDVASAICRPRDPLCQACPIRRGCVTGSRRLMRECAPK
jgi:A/G-specific adenine glycosylase